MAPYLIILRLLAPKAAPIYINSSDRTLKIKDLHDGIQYFREIPTVGFDWFSTIHSVCIGCQASDANHVIQDDREWISA